MTEQQCGAEAIRTDDGTRVCDHRGLDHDEWWSYCWPCPKCGVCKFIGHGPLCIDCYAAPRTERTP